GQGWTEWTRDVHPVCPGHRHFLGVDSPPHPFRGLSTPSTRIERLNPQYLLVSRTRSIRTGHVLRSKFVNLSYLFAESSDSALAMTREWTPPRSTNVDCPPQKTHSDQRKQGGQTVSTLSTTLSTPGAHDHLDHELQGHDLRAR